MLIEEFGADDRILSPDGALALWLAAKNGHRKVVEYLLLRRRGAWRRWKVRSRKYVRFAMYVTVETLEWLVVLVWFVPKGLLSDLPRALVKRAWGGGRG